MCDGFSLWFFPAYSGQIFVMYPLIYELQVSQSQVENGKNFICVIMQFDVYEKVDNLLCKNTSKKK